MAFFLGYSVDPALLADGVATTLEGRLVAGTNVANKLLMMNPISHQEEASKSREASAASCKADGIVLHPIGVLHHLQHQAGA